MSSEALIAKFQALPPAAQREVERLLDLLAEQSKSNGRRPRKPGFKFTWEGGLEALKDKFTAVELQHQTNELR